MSDYQDSYSPKNGLSPISTMTSTASASSEFEATKAATLAATSWDVIQQQIAKTLSLPTSSTSWLDRTSCGAFNVVRFLAVESQASVAVRVPLITVDKPVIAVETLVATMRFVLERTSIPAPRIICFESSDSAAGRPYIAMTVAEGVSLVSVWHEMPDNRRDAILRQIVRLKLEMSSHRFHHIGPVTHNTGSATWHATGRGNNGIFYSAMDFWMRDANRRLESLLTEANSGIYEYGHVWLMRSLIPSLGYSRLDADGFPFMHGDFHSQNIYVADAHTDDPKITCIIDWDDSGPTSFRLFAQPPLFIVDHPSFDPDDEDDQRTSARNTRDQEVFLRMMREEEAIRFPESCGAIADEFSQWKGPYLLGQCLDGGILYTSLWDSLLEHVFGENGLSTMTEIHYGLVEGGLLQPIARIFESRRQAKAKSEVRGASDDTRDDSAKEDE